MGDGMGDSRALSGESGPGATQSCTGARRLYLKVLTLAFAFFSSVRVIAYLPTLWTIHTSGQSDQHSLLTWVTWAGANLTMAGWLYEEGGRRMNSAIAVLLCNFGMCALAVALIVWYRL
jgi:hypothetical protein